MVGTCSNRTVRRYLKRKGVIYCHQYHGKIDGDKFADFVRGHFPALFEMGNNVTGRLFLQDGDSSQNSAVAKEAMAEISCRLFKLPPRSPDLNPHWKKNLPTIPQKNKTNIVQFPRGNCFQNYRDDGQTY